MDSQTFDAFLDDTLAKVRELLASKGAEYVPGTEEVSRFHNFEKSAALNEESLEEALWGFVTKHIVSLSDMVRVDSTDHSLAAWDEKIGDVINYMILLKGIVHHSHEELAKAAPKTATVQFDTMVVYEDNNIDVGDIDFARKADMVHTPPTIRPVR